VSALVPQAELYKYSTTLRSLTQGRAVHTRSSTATRRCRSTRCAKVVETVKKEREEELAAR
jgi:elongation factor G